MRLSDTHPLPAMCKSLQDVWWAGLFACPRVRDRSGVMTSSPETLKYGGGVELASHSYIWKKPGKHAVKWRTKEGLSVEFFFIIFKYCNTVVLVMRQLRFSWKLRWILSCKCINDCKCSENWLQIPCRSFLGFKVKD